MTTIQNTELLPDGTPVSGVLVEVRIYGPTPAAMSSGTNSVVGSAWTRSNSAGYWSMDLIPNSQIEPEGTCYIFTRTYPPTVTGMERGGGKSIEYGIVPPNTVPVDYPEIVVSSPTAQPFTDSELFYHLNDADPHPQYLTQTEGDARYAGIGSGGGGSLPTSEPHTFISDWDSALATKSLSSFATPTANLPMGGKKLTGLAAGTDPTDAATVSQITTPSGVLLIANNLSDVANAATARNNLGLGSAATHPASDFAPSTIGGWLSGSGAPSSGLGSDGMFYFDTTNVVYYGPKTSGSWGSGTKFNPWVFTSKASTVGYSTPYTLQDSDNGLALGFASGTANNITVIVPATWKMNNTADLINEGAGTLTIISDGTSVLHARGVASTTTIYHPGQYDAVTVACRYNTGSNADCLVFNGVT